MRESVNRRQLDLPVDTGPILDKSDTGTQNGSDGILRLLDAMESTLAAVEARVDRLESDVRNLQSLNANRF